MKLDQLTGACKEILPTFKAGFDEMSTENGSGIFFISITFLCGLHGLVHFADCANTSLLETKKGMFGAVAPCTELAIVKPSESATVWLL